MFDFLKKKVTSFIGSITGSQEAPKPVEQAPAEEPAIIEQPPIVQTPQVGETEAKPEAARAKHEAHVVAEQVRKHEEPKPVPEQAKPEPVLSPAEVEPARHVEPKPAEGPKTHAPVPHHPAPQPVAQAPAQAPVPVPAPLPNTVQEERGPERNLAPKLGILSRVKSLVSPEVTLGDAELEPVFSNLQMALLESDVSPDTADYLATDLRKRLVGSKVKKGAMQDFVKEQVRLAFKGLFSAPGFDFFSHISAIKAKGEAPAIILFVGPNGAGKTTTVAKLAKQLGDRGFTSIISASDTFRKAAIEQAVFHGEKLNVRVIKQDYGADPTAVAFDAVSAAKSSGADVVLIDTAGRQETNANLLREMEKMNRVLKPSLKIFVGEAIAGHSLIDQARKFDEAIKLDGLVLTKIDCDAKGGISFSLGHELHVPILFVGTGQEYNDLRQFDAEWISDNVLAA